MTARTFCFDIDGVIATIVPGNAYDAAAPVPDAIAIVNALYDAGHRIVLFTARGSMTGLDWRAVTAAQMQAWGVQHHELRFGKPAADYYVDDRGISVGELKSRLPELANGIAG